MIIDVTPVKPIANMNEFYESANAELESIYNDFMFDCLIESTGTGDKKSIKERFINLINRIITWFKDFFDKIKAKINEIMNKIKSKKADKNVDKENVEKVEKMCDEDVEIIDKQFKETNSKISDIGEEVKNANPEDIEFIRQNAEEIKNTAKRSADIMKKFLDKMDDVIKNDLMNSDKED